MGNVTAPDNASRQYAKAHAAHYGARDLPLALRHYKKVLALHPSAPEADYARTQIENIVNAVIPRDKRLEAQMELVDAHFERH